MPGPGPYGNKRPVSEWGRRPAFKPIPSNAWKNPSARSASASSRDRVIQKMAAKAVNSRFVGKQKNPNLPAGGKYELKDRRPTFPKPLAKGNRKPVGKGTGAMYR